MSAAPQQSNLELVGTKLDIKGERKLDIAFWKSNSTNLIQRVWRGYKARERVYQIRLTLAAIVAQRYIRRVLAIKMRKWLKQQRCSTLVQAFLRKHIALLLADRMRKARVLAAKTLVALRL